MAVTFGSGQRVLRLLVGLCVLLIGMSFLLPKTLNFVSSLQAHPTAQQSIPGKGPCSEFSLSFYEIHYFTECLSATIRLKGSNAEKRALDFVKGHLYLNEDSSVVEVGGFTGNDAAEFVKEYNPYYLVLEPVPLYSWKLNDRFQGNPKVKVLEYGLGKENRTLFVNMNQTSQTPPQTTQTSPVYQTTTQQRQKLHIYDANVFFRGLVLKNSPVDLVYFDCFGCEFDVIEALVSSKIVKHFKYILIHFHPEVLDDSCRYCQIWALLYRTHKPTQLNALQWQTWRLV